jgi:hypothetical protein
LPPLSGVENSNKPANPFAAKFKSARTDSERESAIIDYFSVDRFRKPAESLLVLDPNWAREHYEEWLRSLLKRDYWQIHRLLEPPPKNPMKEYLAKRSRTYKPNPRIYKTNRIAVRRRYYCWKLAMELLAQAETKWKLKTVAEASTTYLHMLAALPGIDTVGENRRQVSDSSIEPAERFHGVSGNLAAARRMETYI